MGQGGALNVTHLHRLVRLAKHCQSQRLEEAVCKTICYDVAVQEEEAPGMEQLAFLQVHP